MKLFRELLAIFLLANGGIVFAKGGDDVGNGGFAYKQSVKILKMATSALEEKIRVSTLKDIVDHPERRFILQDTLGYDDLDKFSKKNSYRGTRKLAMDYKKDPNTVIILKPYFEAFMGKTDTELEDASLEVQKRLLHEAAHIWGYKEDPAEEFAIAFLKNEQTRPSGQIDIKPGFCSCLNGKADSEGDCDSFCASKPSSSQPMLYLNTILSPTIVLNPKLGNLHNWCNAQLADDTTSPQCVLKADDGENVLIIPVTTYQGANTLSANISTLSLKKTYKLKIVEHKSSQAESNFFSLTRKKQTTAPVDKKPLAVSAINQYSCLSFSRDYHEDVMTSFIRQFYYFVDLEQPSPLPPASTGSPWRNIVCHDEQQFPGDDRVDYPRLELEKNLFSTWSRLDPRFITDSAGTTPIERIIRDRALDEYQIDIGASNFFRMINYPNSPMSNPLRSLGYILMPFNDALSGKSFCPTLKNTDKPLLRILGDYTRDTQALYIAEREPQVLVENGVQKIAYGTMFATESMLDRYGFYIENGMKIKADSESFHTRRIHFYWPGSAVDPLNSNGRKLFTVKYPDELNGNSPIGVGSSTPTSDKRIGCVPKGVL